VKEKNWFDKGVDMEKKRSHRIWTRFIFIGFLPTTCYILPPASYAQITFERTYGGTEGDAGYSVQQTIPDGGYIISGYTYSFGAGNTDVYLVKTDSLGDTLWTRTYGGAVADEGRSVQQTSDGGYIIAGCISCNTGGSDVYLIKTDSLGDSLWTRAHVFPFSASGYSVLETRDGGYIIAGVISSITFAVNVLLMKTDPSGNLLWLRDYGDTLNERARSIQQTTDGGYIITGYTQSFGAGLQDVYLIKTDSLLDTLWTRTYGGSDVDVGWSVQQTTDGGYIITGATSSFGAGGTNVYLIKTNSLGDTLWTRTFGDTLGAGGGSVQQTVPDGGYIITGSTNSSGAGFEDVYLIKTDSLGDTLWTRTIGGIFPDWGNSVQQTPDGGFIIAGVTYSFGAGNTDVYLIKTDGSGQVVGVGEENPKSRIHSSKFTLLQNYPNPFSHTTLIHYAISAISGIEKISIQLVLYDISGRLMETLVNREQKPGIYQIQWDGENFPSGIYIYRLQSGNFTDTKKIILLK
jgi:hypothetical protein